MPTRVFIAPTTAAFVSEEIPPERMDSIGVFASGLSGSEEVKIRVYTPAKDDVVDPWEDVVSMTVAKPGKVIIWDSFTYRLEKGVTANPVGITIAENEF